MTPDPDRSPDHDRPLFALGLSPDRPLKARFLYEPKARSRHRPPDVLSLSVHARGAGEEEEGVRLDGVRARERQLVAAVEDARARHQALRQEGLLLGLDRAQEGARRRERRRREEQAARRVLHGQDALPDGLLRRRRCAYFDKIVQAGDQHTYHGATLKWLAALSRVLPETSGILEKIGTYDPSALERSVARVGQGRAAVPARPPLLPEGRRRRLRQGDRAVQQVDREERVLHQGEVLRGRHLRPQVRRQARGRRVQGHPHHRRGAPAAVPADDIDDYRELAQLQMARVFYSTQQFDTSIKYFEKLRRTRPTGPSRCSRRRGRTS